jgi:type 1 glutamine amidotransferase
MLRLAAVLLLGSSAVAADPWLTLPGKSGPGSGKKVVLVSGDEEYRSEEALPQLAKILAERHGFDCTVLFAIDPKTGHIDPDVTDNIPGLEALKSADLLVIATRFRNLPDAQMKFVVDYVEAGKPVVGLRTATHAFNLKGSAYQRYTWNGPDGGFGRRVLGETWVAHHGQHGKEGTRGIVAPGQQSHPILRGIAPGSVFGPTDVYTVKLPLPGDSVPLLLGEVTTTLAFDSPAVPGKKNDPMMPVAWSRTHNGGRVFTTTMGASQDLSYEGTRRLLVNACYWAAGLDPAIPAKSDVAVVGVYEPSPFKFKGARKGLTPADLK